VWISRLAVGSSDVPVCLGPTPTLGQHLSTAIEKDVFVCQSVCV
jgi:hypothetical protein